MTRPSNSTALAQYELRYIYLKNILQNGFPVRKENERWMELQPENGRMKG
jgi:hypothetical protein